MLRLSNLRSRLRDLTIRKIDVATADILEVPRAVVHTCAHTRHNVAHVMRCCWVTSLHFPSSQHAYELSVELKEGVREAKISQSSPDVKFGMWANLNPKSGRYPGCWATVSYHPPFWVYIPHSPSAHSFTS